MNINSHPACVKICSAINLLHIVIITIPNKVDGLACRGQFSLAWVPSYIDILTRPKDFYIDAGENT